MSENCVKETIKEKSLIENSSNKNLLLLHRLHSDDVVEQKQKDVCASTLLPPTPSIMAKLNESDIPTKKRKTRRGKSKRRHPYNRKNRGGAGGSSNNSNHHNNNNNDSRKLNKLINKPEAPYNSNQFLLEDHGDIENLDENLKYAEQKSTTSGGGRTRDSSISIDTDGEFYSSPDDEEQFLIKDFVDQYESVQAERLQTMAKDQLIREYLALESKVEYLTKRLRKKEKSQQQQQQQCDDNNTTNNNSNCRLELEKEIDRLMNENDALKRELAVLHRDIDKNCNKSNNNNNNNNNINNCTTSSDSEDSETDSDDSCSSTTTTTSTSSSSSSGGSCCTSKPPSPAIDYTQTNGHSAGVGTV